MHFPDNDGSLAGAQPLQTLPRRQPNDPTNAFARLPAPRRGVRTSPCPSAHQHHAAALGILLSVGRDDGHRREARVQEVNHGNCGQQGVRRERASSGSPNSTGGRADGSGKLLNRAGSEGHTRTACAGPANQAFETPGVGRARAGARSRLTRRPAEVGPPQTRPQEKPSPSAPPTTTAPYQGPTVPPHLSCAWEPALNPAAKLAQLRCSPASSPRGLIPPYFCPSETYMPATRS